MVRVQRTSDNISGYKCRGYDVISARGSVRSHSPMNDHSSNHPELVMKKESCSTKPRPIVSWVLIARNLTFNVFTEINTTRLDGKRRQGESQMFIYVQFQKVPDAGNSCTKSVRSSVMRKPGEVTQTSGRYPCCTHRTKKTRSTLSCVLDVARRPMHMYLKAVKHRITIQILKGHKSFPCHVAGGD